MRKKLLLILLGMASLQAAKIVALSGDVKVRRAGGSPVALKSSDFVNGGDLIVTGSGASVRLKLRDEGVITVGGNSKYMLSEDSDPSERGGSKSMLVSGRVSVDVSRISKLYQNKDESFKVYTPSAVCGVRGTQFDLSADKNGRMRLGVTEGNVAVGNDPLRDDAKVSGAPEVKKGAGMRADKGGKLEPGKPQVASPFEIGKELSGNPKVDGEYEAHYVAMISDLAGIIGKLYAESKAKAAESEKLVNEGVSAGPATDAGKAKIEAGRKIGIEKFLKAKEALHRINQFLGYLALLENNGVNIPQKSDIEKIRLELAAVR